MSQDIVIVNLTAVFLLIFIIWWFFGSTPRAAFSNSNEPILILVKDGIYQPAYIQVHAGQSVKLHFLRHDATACAGSVSFPQLNASYPLPVNQLVEVTLPPLVAGELDFTCQMGMYKGKIVIT